MNGKFEGIDINNATSTELAEMLEEYNTWRRGGKPYDKPGAKMPFDVHELGEIIDSASMQLRYIVPLAIDAYIAWMGGTMNDVREAMKKLGMALEKEEK
jgi:hypothetical protein